MSDNTAHNHALTDWSGPLGLPDFTAFGDEDFAPAFDVALAQDLAEVEAIAGATEDATIEKTLQSPATDWQGARPRVSHFLAARRCAQQRHDPGAGARNRA